jgi:hypothetical protein
MARKVKQNAGDGPGQRSYWFVANINVGSLVRVTRGQMRNSWYPSHRAQYVPYPEQKQLRLAETPMTRRYNYVAAADSPGAGLDQAEADTPDAPLEAATQSLRVAERISVRLPVSQRTRQI